MPLYDRALVFHVYLDQDLVRGPTEVKGVSCIVGLGSPCLLSCCLWQGNPREATGGAVGGTGSHYLPGKPPSGSRDTGHQGRRVGEGLRPYWPGPTARGVYVPGVLGNKESV